jgi:predicted AAA+ superfamily ATPase
LFPLYYYRDSNGKEIDPIIQKDGVLYPIEIKKSANPVGAAKHFNVLAAIATGGASDEAPSGLRMKIGPGNVICLASKPRPIPGGHWTVPAWLI